MTLTIELEREDGGRWLAEAVELPGVFAYGRTCDEAIAEAQGLALRVLADHRRHADVLTEIVNVSFVVAAGAKL